MESIGFHWDSKGILRGHPRNSSRSREILLALLAMLVIPAVLVILVISPVTNSNSMGAILVPLQQRFGAVGHFAKDRPPAGGPVTLPDSG